MDQQEGLRDRLSTLAVTGSLLWLLRPLALLLREFCACRERHWPTLVFKVIGPLPASEPPRRMIMPFTPLLPLVQQQTAAFLFVAPLMALEHARWRPSNANTFQCHLPHDGFQLRIAANFYQLCFVL